MAWSGDFKKRRFEELNHMKLKDRMNYTMCSEYQYILNGIVDPTKTHNFSDDYKLETDIHRRRYARHHDFMQTKMTNLKKKPMVSRTGYVKDHKGFNKYPPPAYDSGDDSWKYDQKGEVSKNSKKGNKSVSVQINVNKQSATSKANGYFAERFRQLLTSQLSFDLSN